MLKTTNNKKITANTDYTQKKWFTMGFMIFKEGFQKKKIKNISESRDTVLRREKVASASSSRRLLPTQSNMSSIGAPVAPAEEAVPYPYEVLSHRARRLIGSLQRHTEKANIELDVAGAKRTRVSVDSDEAQLRFWSLINQLSELLQCLKYVDALLEGHVSLHGPELGRLRAQMGQSVNQAEKAYEMLFRTVCTGKYH